MTVPSRLSKRQENLGPAGFFEPEALTPAANQLRVKAGYAFIGGQNIVVQTADQLTGGFAVVIAGNRRYDLVYLDTLGAPQILQGNQLAVAQPFPEGAPGWTGTNPGPAIPDNVQPVAWVKVDEPATVVIDHADITQINGFLKTQRELDGYFVDKGDVGSVPAGPSSVVTANFVGEDPNGSASLPFLRGVITVAPLNVVHILDQKKDEIIHAATGSKIYGRITFAVGVWTLSYFHTTALGAEAAVANMATDTTLGPGLTDIQLVGTPKIFSRNDLTRPMFASPAATISDQVAAVQVGVVPLGGILLWQPPTAATAPAVPTLPLGYEYCDGAAVTTPGSPYLPANMPGFLKPNLMITPTGGLRRFPRGADYSVGSHGAANVEPTGGTDTIPNAGGLTPFNGSFGGNTGSTSINHTHAISSDGAHTHDAVTQVGPSTPPRYASDNGATPNIATASAGAHSHSGATGTMSSNDPHSHTVSGNFSGNIDTTHNHGGENRPAFLEAAYIMRVL